VPFAGTFFLLEQSSGFNEMLFDVKMTLNQIQRMYYVPDRGLMKAEDYRDRAQGFGLCTLAILVLYLVTGMNAGNMSEIEVSVLMAGFTACCALYVTNAFITTAKRFLSLIAFVPAFALYLIILKAVFGSLQNERLDCLVAMENTMMWCGLGTVLVSAVTLIVSHKFSYKDLITVILCVGFLLRMIMVLFTPLHYYQHDLSDFSVIEAGYHDDYIMIIHDYSVIPNCDVRGLGLLYHPPLHHLLCAIFLKIQEHLPLRFAEDFNGLKILPMLWTSYLVLFVKKILEYFKIKGKALAISLLPVVFCPQMIFLAIQLNNDALAIMLFVASFYLALKWYSEPDLTTILFLALAIGCAMMTKLSMGFVAFPVAWLFAVRLFKTVKAMRSNTDRKARYIFQNLIKQFVFFALLVFPLGMWFPLRNLILYGTPITYVYAIESAIDQDVWMFSPLQRLFLPSAELIRYPYLMEGKEVNDYNIFLALIKSGLFDEREFINEFLRTTAEIMLMLAGVLILLILVFAVIGVCRTVTAKNERIRFIPESISLWIMSIVLIVSECSFCFSFPVVCTEAFRYIAPVIVPAAVWSGRVLMMSVEPKGSRILKVLSTVFMIASAAFVITVILFYGASTQYHLIWNDLLNK